MNNSNKPRKINPKINLQKIREDNHYSQLKVAEDNNTYQEVISRIESGSRNATLDFMIQLSKYYNCSMDYICDLTDDPTPISILSLKSDLTEKEKHILSQYNSLNKEDKLRFENIIEGVIVALKNIQ